MAEVIELFILMLLIAGLAFAPLGYFIYVYAAKNGEPFGDLKPHDDSESPMLKWVEKLTGMINKQVPK